MKKIIMMSVVLGVFLIGCTNNVKTNGNMQTTGEDKIKKCEETSSYTGRSGCFSDLAIELSEPALCEKVEVELTKERCYYFIAKNTNDARLCEKRVGATNYAECFGEVASELNDMSICDTLDTENHDKCLYIMATASNEIEICQKMKSGSDGCIAAMASRT